MLPYNFSNQTHQDSLGFLSTLLSMKQEEMTSFLEKNEDIYKNCLSDLQSNNFWSSEDKEKLQNLTAKFIDSSEDLEPLNKIIKLSIKNKLVSTTQALHSAVKNFDLKKVKFLLDLGTNINAHD